MLIRLILFINVIFLKYVGIGKYLLFSTDFFKILSIILFTMSFGYPRVASNILMNNKQIKYKKDI